LQFFAYLAWRNFLAVRDVLAPSCSRASRLKICVLHEFPLLSKNVSQEDSASNAPRDEKQPPGIVNNIAQRESVRKFLAVMNEVFQRASNVRGQKAPIRTAQSNEGLLS